MSAAVDGDALHITAPADGPASSAHRTLEIDDIGCLLRLPNPEFAPTVSASRMRTVLAFECAGLEPTAEEGSTCSSGERAADGSLMACSSRLSILPTNCANMLRAATHSSSSAPFGGPVMRCRCASSDTVSYTHLTLPTILLV